MNMTKMTQEHISAFADSELADQEFTAVLAALRASESREAWDIYHRIGDVLRSKELAYEMRPQAQQRLVALLDTEPTVFAPVKTDSRAKELSPGFEQSAFEQGELPSLRIGNYFFKPGFAIAAAAVAFFAAPSILVAFNGWSTDISSSSVLAVVEKNNIKFKTDVATKDSVAYVPETRSSNVMLYDSNVDEYLFAHQRFSRSGYSNAQYASPTSLTTEIQSN